MPILAWRERILLHGERLWVWPTVLVAFPFLGGDQPGDHIAGGNYCGVGHDSSHRRIWIEVDCGLLRFEDRDIFTNHYPLLGEIERSAPCIALRPKVGGPRQ